MISAKVFVLIVVLGVALAYNPGQYVPKSFYVIDQFGRQSEPVFIRNRRDIMSHPLFRVRRGDSYASSSSHASASSSSSSSSGVGGGPIYYGDYVPSVAHDPSGILGQVQNLLNNIPTGGPSSNSGAQSFASASSSSSAGGGGLGSGQSYGGLGSGHDAGYSGPVLFSRFGEAKGTGVHVSGQAQGEKGAFSSSSSSSDDSGNVKYSVQSGKY